MDKDIGRIVEVRGLKVRAKLFKLLPPYIFNNGKIMSSPKVNSYVKTKVGLDTIICKVIGEYNIESNEEPKGFYLDLQVIGYFENSKFIQGLRLLPIVSANIQLLNDSDYQLIYDYDVNSSFLIGNDLFETGRNVYLQYDAIIPTHIGIFGNTGSGKSNTLAFILSNYIKRIGEVQTDKAKVIVFDLNNEYGNQAICDESMKSIYSLSTRKQSTKRVPIDFNQLDEDDFCILLNATAKTQTPTVKHAYQNMSRNFNESKYRKKIVSAIKNGKNNLFMSLRFQLNGYIDGLESFYWHSTYNKFYYLINDERIYSDNKRIEHFYNKISIRVPEGKMERFRFELLFSIATYCDRGINEEYLMPLVQRSEKLIKDFNKVFDFESDKKLFENKPIVVIQLADVNNDMTNIVPAVISNCIFQEQISNKGDELIKSVVNIVVDEAHNILNDSNDLHFHSQTVEVFEKIIKEGRKFGTFLMISSQRPSDISNTILSQMHNYFIHKLVNPSDLQQIRKTVAFLDEDSLNFLTILAPGECIVSGTGVKTPVFLKVNELDSRSKPNSSNMALFGENGLFTK